jgi:hypothetical protein
MEYRHGALYVVESASSREPIVRALKQIDDRLFVERQATFDGEQVWVVNVDLGRDDPTGVVTLCEWRDGDGKPIPYLAEGLVRQVAQMERDGSKLNKKVIEANREFTERRRRRMEEETAEMTREIVSGIGWRKTTLPRGQNLYMARARQRAKGIVI